MSASKLLKCSVLAISAALVDPCLSSDDDQKFNKNRQASKKDQGWQVVTSRGGRPKQKPQTPQVSPPLRQKKVQPFFVPAPRTKEEIEKQAKLDAKWNRTRTYLLGEMEALNIPNANAVVVPLLNRLRQETSMKMIQQHFKDYMFFMSYLPKMKEGAHVRAFRNIYTNNSGSLLLMNTLLGSLSEEKRREFAPLLHEEALSDKFLQLEKNGFSLFEKFDAADKFTVLQLVMKRETLKLLRNRTFSQAFNELMEMLKYDNQKARTKEDASAHLKLLKALATRVDIDALKINECKNRGLAWAFLLASEDVKISERGFADQFNSVYDTYWRHSYAGNEEKELGLLKNDVPLFFQVLKMLLAEGPDRGENPGQYNEFASTVFNKACEPRLELLQCMHAHRNLWYKKPIASQYTLGGETFFRASAQTQKPLTAQKLFLLLKNLAVDLELDRSHWEDAITDIAKLSEKTEDLVERLERRLNSLKTFPSGIKKQMAFDFWKMYVAEQLLVGRDAEDERQNMFSYRQASRFTYTLELIEFLRSVPENQIIKIFQIMQGLLAKVSVDGSGHKDCLKSMRSVLRDFPNDRISNLIENFEKFCTANAVTVTSFREYVTYSPFLLNDEWLSSLLKSPLRYQASVMTILLEWYERLDAVMQEEVHGFWKGELVKADPNVKLARMILEHARDLPSTLRDLLTAAAFSKRQEYMRKMNSDELRVAHPAAKWVTENQRELGIIDPDNDEVYQLAGVVLAKAAFGKRQEFMTKMNSDERQVARTAAKEVVRDPREFGIVDPDNDEVYQYAIVILARTENSRNLLNPYNVLKHHQRMAEEVVSHEMIRTPSVKPIINGDSYYVRGDVFNFMRVNQATYAQLPKHSKTYIRDMKAQVLAKEPDLRGAMLGATEGGFLEHLLATKGAPKEVVPAVNAKLIAIVAYLQSLPNEVIVAGNLTQQEQEFASFMSHAQACETNKTEVIHKFYVSLPEEARLKKLKSAEDSSEDHLRQIFEKPLWDLAEELFSCEKPFLRTLCGLRKGEVFPNASHIEMFVKNLLLMDVPFYTRHMHDPYTRNCVPESLLTYRRTGVLELLFSKFIKVEDLAGAAEVAINRQMIVPKSPTIVRVQEFFEQKGRVAELEFDDETQITTIPNHKVYELLHLLNILQVEEK